MTQIMAVPKTHAFVLCAVLDIPEGRPVTVSYSVGGYGDYLGEVAECACASCHPDRPPERTHGKGGSE